MCQLFLLLQYWLNDYTSSIGLGVYHSGIEIHSKGILNSVFLFCVNGNSVIHNPSKDGTESENVPFCNQNNLGTTIEEKQGKKGK